MRKVLKKPPLDPLARMEKEVAKNLDSDVKAVDGFGKLMPLVRLMKDKERTKAINQDDTKQDDIARHLDEAVKEFTYANELRGQMIEREKAAQNEIQHVIWLRLKAREDSNE